MGLDPSVDQPDPPDTPPYVFDLVEALRSGKPLDFRGHRVPADVQRALMGKRPRMGEGADPPDRVGSEWLIAGHLYLLIDRSGSVLVHPVSRPLHSTTFLVRDVDGSDYRVSVELVSGGGMLGGSR